MRGDISYVAKRYCRANNEFVEGYDSGKEKSFITYWDVNNLYGAAMLEYLPYDGFEWVDEEEVSSIYYFSVSDSSYVGYILKVDLEYPSELHELHNDYPSAPEKLKVREDMLSDYCLDIAKRYGIKVGDVSKFVPNLRDKSCYVLHYRVLQLYVSLGMVVKRVYEVLKFRQSDWLKGFVLFNTKKRMNAANEFENTFLKLIINSVYGKTMENVKKRVNVKVINNKKDYLKVVSRPSFVSRNILDKNLVAVHKMKPVLLLNKPVYVGFSILELSKMIMYDWHYNYIVSKFDCRLLFTDADSLVYEINCMKRILVKGNKIGTYDICKISLSCFDDKRYVLGDGVSSLAYGHARAR